MPRALLLLLSCCLLLSVAPRKGPFFRVTLPASMASTPLDGRLLVLLSTDPTAEPRTQINDGPTTQMVFGLDVENWTPGQTITVSPSPSVYGWPVRGLDSLKPGEYNVQILLHKYETFHRADGHTLKLPMDRGEGQVWSKAPGNLYSKPVKATIANGSSMAVSLDQVIPAIPEPKNSKYIRHIKVQSQRLTKFWGRPMFLGAHILVPEGFDEHPEARYPLAIYHGHFPSDFSGFRPEPPDPNLKPDYSERFHVAGYNRIEQQEAHDFFKKWTSPGFPRMLIVEIQHANQFYDDSYAVNSANIGPYGDAIMYELLPQIEKQFRGIGKGWARFTYGGSTGGWEALAVQMFYPDEFNGSFAACPDPVDYRAYTVVDLYKDKNAYYTDGPHVRIPKPAKRNYLGQISATMEQINQYELALGTKTRSGQQWDIWEAVNSPVGPDGYPKRIYDKVTGVIDPQVAAYWRDNYDLRYILERDWAKLGPKLRGKLHIYCGDMDNYYLNNAVYLMEEFLKKASNPPAEAEVAYGDRAEHCWNGDPTQPNHISRLRYNTMYLPKMLQRMQAASPPGADLKSWRY